MDGIVDNIGFPPSGINLTLSNSGVIGTSDGEILIALKPEHRIKPADYIREMRRTLPREFPGTEFYFQPADIVSQVLNFGLPAPIDVQLSGMDVQENFRLAREFLPRLKMIPGAADVHIQQAYDQPQLNIDVDRMKAAASGDDGNNSLQQRHGFPDQQLSNGAQFLGEPAGRYLSNRHANAAIPDRFVAGPAVNCR